MRGERGRAERAHEPQAGGRHVDLHLARHVAHAGEVRVRVRVGVRVRLGSELGLGLGVSVRVS